MLEFTFVEPFGGEYVEVQAQGSWELSRIYDLILAIRAQCEAVSCKRALADLSELSNMPKDSDRYYSGERLAEVMRSEFSVAVVAKGEFITGLGETVAVNRGATHKMFSDRQEAIKWLLAN